MDNYFDTAKNTGVYNGKTYNDHNEYRKAAGGDGGGSGGGYMSAIQQAIDLQNKAIQPAVQSYQASIPEVQAKYTQANQQLESSKQPLKERYDNLLGQIKGNQTTAVNSQTRITNNELGKRGILGDSTLAQQEIQNSVSPIDLQYSGMAKDATLNQDSALRDINNSQANLTTQQTSDLRAIQQAIASLQSGAASNGASLGQSIYANELQNNLARQQESRLASAQSFEQDLASRNADIEYQLKQKELSRPYAGGGSGGSSSSIGDLLSMLQGGGQEQSQMSSTPNGWKFVPEINKYVTGYDNQGRAVYSDGTRGYTYGKK